MKTGHSIALPSNPIGIVRNAARQRTIKERLAKIPNVNHNGASASNPQFTQPRADLPGQFKIEFRPDQFRFLKVNLFEIAVKVHGREGVKGDRSATGRFKTLVTLRWRSVQACH